MRWKLICKSALSRSCPLKSHLKRWAQITKLFILVAGERRVERMRSKTIEIFL